MVFQSYALYRAITARKNITFGMQCRHVPRAAQAEAVDRVAKLQEEIKRLHQRLGTPADFDRHAVFTCWRVPPGMCAQGGRLIISLSSGAWVRGFAELELHSAAKAGIARLSNPLTKASGEPRKPVANPSSTFS